MRSRSVGVMVSLILSAAALQAQPLTSPSFAPQDMTSVEAVDASSRFWVRGEYLLWWVCGDHVPALITTSPTGTPVAAAGVQGQPGTRVVFGDQDPNSGARSGGRLVLGAWLDPEQTWGVEARFFMLESQSHGLTVASPGDPILARPFFNTLSGLLDAELVAFPGILQGSATVASRSSYLIGADASLRANLYSLEDDWGGFQIDLLGGYRYLDLAESLAVLENLGTTNPAGPAPLGTAFVISDRFATHNQFHGGQLGLAAVLSSGSWSVGVQGKVGLGETSEVLNVAGASTLILPGAVPNLQTGGLLALVSNIGRHHHTAFSCIPELEVNLGYQLTANWRITVGYTLLYWTGVIRPGDQVDRAVNPNLLPPVLLVGDQRPIAEFQRSTLTAQGLTVGLGFSY